MNKKLWAVYILGFFMLGWTLYSAFMSVQAHVIGLYTKIDLSTKDVADMKEQLVTTRERLTDMTFEQFKFYERDIISNQLKVLNKVEKFVAVLESANQT